MGDPVSKVDRVYEEVLEHPARQELKVNKVFQAKMAFPVKEVFLEHLVLLGR